jgi:hypothetical protein
MVPKVRSLHSPHTWGSAVAAGASVQFDGALPQTRGGLSHAAFIGQYPVVPSPHAWGLFPHGDDLDFARPVFPTCVGVCPGYGGDQLWVGTLLSASLNKRRTVRSMP